MPSTRCSVQDLGSVARPDKRMWKLPCTPAICRFLPAGGAARRDRISHLFCFRRHGLLPHDNALAGCADFSRYSCDHCSVITLEICALRGMRAARRMDKRPPIRRCHIDLHCHPFLFMDKLVGCKKAERRPGRAPGQERAHAIRGIRAATGARCRQRGRRTGLSGSLCFRKGFATWKAGCALEKNHWKT